MGKLLIFFLLAAGVTATAQSMPLPTPDMDTSGNRFLELCDDAVDTKPVTPIHFACVTYVVGLADGMGIFADKGGLGPQWYCSPDGLTHGQTLRILVKYVKDHPEKAHLQTQALMLLALSDAFPCPITPAKQPNHGHPAMIHPNSREEKGKLK